MVRLLADGRTELLKGFVSTRTKRKFSAFLVRGADGKVGFEFEKKEPRAKAADAAGSTAASPKKAAPRRKTASS